MVVNCGAKTSVNKGKGAEGLLQKGTIWRKKKPKEKEGFFLTRKEAGGAVHLHGKAIFGGFLALGDLFIRFS